MTSLADLYELHTKECREAGRIDDPVHLVILRLMARAWLEGRRGRAAHIDANDIAKRRRSCAF